MPSPPEFARTELVRRWLRAFGPATVTDIKWWFGNTLTWARQALRDLDAVEVDLDGTPGFVAARRSRGRTATTEPWCALLPGLDVTTMGWFDRDWYLGGHRGQVFDTNGNGGPTAWCDGRIVGAWGQDADGRVEVRLLEDVGRAAQKALQRRADAADRMAGTACGSARASPPRCRSRVDQAQLVERSNSWCWMLLHKVADSRRTSLNGLGAGIHLHVIDPMHVGLLDLSNSGADLPVAACGLAALQFVGVTMHTHEYDVDIDHDSQQIHQPPRLAQNMVHHDVVAR